MDTESFFPGLFLGGLLMAMVCLLTLGVKMSYTRGMLNAACGECPGSETCGDERQLVCSSGGWELSGAKK